MSYCEVKGKDRVIHLTEEDASPSTADIVLGEKATTKDLEDDEPQGLIRDDGTINWNCPCLGGMAVGPCGTEFRTAFECFHTSTEEVKGSDCIEKFAEMQECLKMYPELYDKSEDQPKLSEAEEKMIEEKVDQTLEENGIQTKFGDNEKKESN